MVITLLPKKSIPIHITIISHQLYHLRHPPPMLVSKFACSSHSPQHTTHHDYPTPSLSNTHQYQPCPSYYDTKQPLLPTIICVHLHPIPPRTNIFLANITPSLKTLSYIPHTLLLQPTNLKTTHPLLKISLDIPPSYAPIHPCLTHLLPSSSSINLHPPKISPPNLILYKWLFHHTRCWRPRSYCKLWSL